MTPAGFTAALGRLGLSQAGFCRLVAALGDGAAPPPRSVNRWAVGTHDVPPLAAALLGLIERLPPATRERILQHAARPPRA